MHDTVKCDSVGILAQKKLGVMCECERQPLALPGGQQWITEVSVRPIELQKWQRLCRLKHNSCFLTFVYYGTNLQLEIFAFESPV